jgi:hypothetical protein
MLAACIDIVAEVRMISFLHCIKHGADGCIAGFIVPYNRISHEYSEVAFVKCFSKV